MNIEGFLTSAFQTIASTKLSLSISPLDWLGLDPVRSQTIFIEILLLNHGLAPMLVERWKFEITQKAPLTSGPEEPWHVEERGAIRAINSVSTEITMQSAAQMSMLVKGDLSELAVWETQCKRRSCAVCSISTAAFECVVTADYRVLSSEFEVVPRSRLSSTSTDIDFSVKTFIVGRKPSILDSESFLEEDELGFRLICSELWSEHLESSEDEELFKSSFEDENSPLSTTDGEIFEYKELCRRSRKPGLFEGANSLFTQIKSIAREWEGVHS